MSETSFDEKGNKVTTHYDKKPRTEYEGTARGDSRKKGESRVDQNRRLREEAREVSSTRPDSRQSIKKEKVRKEKVEDEIAGNARKVRYKQEMEEEAEEETPKPRKQKSQPSINQRVGSRIAPALGGMGGAPAWLNRGGGTPAFMRMGNAPLPAAYGMGMNKPPGWLFGGMSGNTSPTKKGKRQQESSNGLPSWFRY